VSGNAADDGGIPAFRCLVSRNGRIFSRSQLINHIYDDHPIVSDRTVVSHIKKLRKKLNQLVPDQELIYSAYGVGYRYDQD